MSKYGNFRISQFPQNSATFDTFLKKKEKSFVRVTLNLTQLLGALGLLQRRMNFFAS